MKMLKWTRKNATQFITLGNILLKEESKSKKTTDKYATTNILELKTEKCIFKHQTQMC